MDASSLPNFGIALTVRPDKKGEKTGLSVEDKIGIANVLADYTEIKQDDYVDAGEEKFRVVKKIKNDWILTITRPIETNYATRIDGRTVEEVEQWFGGKPKPRIIDIDINYLIESDDRGALEYLNQTAKAARDAGVLIKRSWHDYKGPSDKQKQKMVKRAMDQMYYGTDIYKFCTTANETKDVTTIIEFVLDFTQDEDNEKSRIVAWPMKEKGRAGRILTWMAGGAYSFAAPPWGQWSSPGQIRAEVMIKLREDDFLLHKAWNLYSAGEIEKACEVIDTRIEALAAEI